MVQIFCVIESINEVIFCYNGRNNSGNNFILNCIKFLKWNKY